MLATCKVSIVRTYTKEEHVNEACHKNDPINEGSISRQIIIIRSESHIK